MNTKAKLALAVLGLGVTMRRGHRGSSADTTRRAIAEWERGVREPPAGDPAEIDKYIRGPRGLAWTWEDPYVRDGQFQWCGAFVAWALGLLPVIRTHFLASCTRLINRHSTWGNWTAGSGVGLAAGSRMVPVGQARRGDIGIVGDGSDPEGQHIVLILSRDATGVQTVEGNSFGLLPDGTRGQGVVRNHRPFKGRGGGYYLMHVIRPIATDFEGA